ncbi:MAG: CsgG/HfaB family protein [Desulfosudaceae bacterium]
MKQATVLTALILVAALIAVTGCSPKMTGAVKDDSSLTGVGDDLGKRQGEYTGPKLRVGVVNFQNKTSSKNVGFGEAAADILGTILHKTGQFIIIPQQDMKSILDQQSLGTSGAIDPSTAAKMGKVMGLNAIVTGAITEYSEVEEGQDLLIHKSKKQVARVTVDYRVVDTTTGVQLLADSGRGVYDKSTGGFLGLGSKSSYDSDLKQGALRDALQKAMVNMMDQLESTEWRGRIAQIKGDTVYVNAGKKTGLKVGDVLKAQELGEMVHDPQTREAIGRAPGNVKGELMVTGFFGKDGSVATIRSGDGFKANDLVMLKN